MLQGLNDVALLGRRDAAKNLVGDCGGGSVGPGQAGYIGPGGGVAGQSDSRSQRLGRFQPVAGNELERYSLAAEVIQGICRAGAQDVVEEGHAQQMRGRRRSVRRQTGGDQCLQLGWVRRADGHGPSVAMRWRRGQCGCRRAK